MLESFGDGLRTLRVSFQWFCNPHTRSECTVMIQRLLLVRAEGILPAGGKVESVESNRRHDDPSKDRALTWRNNLLESLFEY